ncbi:MAG: EF-P lysine aminoacylase EpmA [Smithellaceae bacterium]
MSASNLDDIFLLARKKEALHLRARLIQNIRLFFIEHGFLEVETPLRIPSPAPEEHIEAFPSGDWFLQTSPELCMKRLLAAGFPLIFQISKCFRAGERGNLHLPEFTMLEWYVTKFDYLQLMSQCEKMIFAVAANMDIARHCIFRNKKIDLTPPWEKITVQEAFEKYASVTLEEALNKNKFDQIIVDYIEPYLGVNRPTFLYDYPAKLAALAKLKDGNTNVAERFELYIGGMEIANGFSELNDTEEQRRRFEQASQLRAQKNWPQYSMPEKFLQALQTIPESAGIALGIDRLAMIFAHVLQIDDIISFTPEIL